jgi:hypothetical protein
VSEHEEEVVSEYEEESDHDTTELEATVLRLELEIERIRAHHDKLHQREVSELRR